MSLGTFKSLLIEFDLLQIKLVSKSNPQTL